METTSALPLNLITQNLFLSHNSKKYKSNKVDDTLKCGSCRTEFLLSDIVYFIQHKSTSSCNTYNTLANNEQDENSLTCSTCPESFKSAKSLLEHAQFTHKIKIFLEPPQTSLTHNDTNTNNYNNNNTRQESNSSQTSINSNNKTNEIFIDFVSSDKHYSDGQSYNITVSSSSSSSSSNNQQDHESKDSSKRHQLSEDKQIEQVENEKSSLSYDTLENNTKNQRKRKQQMNKEFLCEICNAKFNQKIHLTKHTAKHTGIKPFKCTECNYSTVERSHLKVHIRIHTGEKPFKCSYCEYATAQSSTLKIHHKRHHNNKSTSNYNKQLNSWSNNTSATHMSSSTQSNCGNYEDDELNDDNLMVNSTDDEDTQLEFAVDESNDDKNGKRKRSDPIGIHVNVNETNKLLGLAKIALEQDKS